MLNEVPLRGDAKAITVNWLMIEVRDAAGKATYTNSFITDLSVSAANVAALAGWTGQVEDRERKLQRPED